MCPYQTDDQVVRICASAVLAIKTVFKGREESLEAPRIPRGRSSEGMQAHVTIVSIRYQWLTRGTHGPPKMFAPWLTRFSCHVRIWKISPSDGSSTRLRSHSRPLSVRISH